MFRFELGQRVMFHGVPATSGVAPGETGTISGAARARDRETYFVELDSGGSVAAHVSFLAPAIEPGAWQGCAWQPEEVSR